VKYRDWQRSQPAELPEGFVKLSGLFTAAEAEKLRHEAAFTGDGTYSAAIRHRMGMYEIPYGLKRAVQEITEAPAASASDTSAVSAAAAREEVLQAVRDLRDEWEEKRYYAVEAMQLKNSFVASLVGLLEGFEDG
jgi:hypothetical protein